MNQAQLTNIYLDQSKDHIWIFNLDFQLLYANKRWLSVVKEVAGVEKKIYDSVFAEGFGEGYTEKWKAYYIRAINGEFLEIEEHYSHPETNDIQYGQITLKPLRGEDHKIFAVACQSRDITSIVKQKSEASQLIDASLDIFCTINEQGNFVFVTAATASHWGYEPEELIGSPYVDLILEEDLQKTEEVAAAILGGQDVKSFVNRYKKKNGGIAYNLWSVKWDNTSKLMYCVVRDAQEILEQKEQVLQSEQRFKALIQEGSDLIGILDEEGNYSYVSPTSTAVLGMAPEAFIGRNALEFVHPDDVELTLASLKKVVHENRVVIPPLRFQNHKKEWRWLETVLTNMLDNPAVKGIVANSRDITEEKNLRELNRQVGKLAKIGSWEFDAILNTIFWSDEVHQIYGTDPRSFVPNVDAAINFYREDYRHLALSSFEKCILTQEPYTIEAVIVNSNNKEIWVRTTAKAEYSDGVCTRVYGSFQDITERKEAEIRLQLLADNLPGIVFQYLFYPDGTEALKYVTKGSEQLWGYAAEAVVENNQLIWERIRAAGDIEYVRKSISDALTTKAKWTCRFNYVMPTGELRTHFGIGTPSFLIDGTILFNCVLLDITQEAKNEKLLEQVTEIARIGSWELDLINTDGENMYWSPMLFDILELDTSYNPTLTGGIEFHIGESKERIQAALNNLIANGTEFVEDILIRTAKGNKRWNRAIGKSETVNNRRIRIYGSYQDIHERKVAELELLKAKEKAEKSDAQFKAYTEQSPIAIYTTNIDGDCVYANETWLQMTGMNIKEVLGKGWINALHPDDLVDVGNNWYTSIKSNGKWAYEYRFVNKEGKVTWVKGTAKELFNEKKELVGYLGTNINITEQKYAQQEKDSLQATIENSLNEIYTFDTKTFRFNYVNKGALLNLGYSKSEIINLTPLDIKPDYTLASFTALIAPLVSNEKEKIVFFTQHQRKDGSQYPTEIHLQLVVENNNKRFLAIVLDITERKKAEEENKFKANLLSTVGQAAIATSLDGVVKYWNTAAQNIYGWTPEEAIGKNIMELTTIETDKEQANQIMDVLKKGQTWSGEFKVRNKNGTNFPAFITNSPIYNDNNILSGIIGISSDITEEVKNKELLSQYTYELERSNEELEQFAFVASHDLQEPLRMISSFMELLQRKYEDQLDEKGHLYIDYAIDGAKRMRQIILDLLAYSRANKPTEGKEEVDLNQLYLEYQQLRRQLISKKRAVIKSDHLPTLNTYRAAITQIFHCLLDNALKYSKDDLTPLIVIQVVENKNDWKFSIEDNGIGIDAEFYEKIFLIFQRLHNKDAYSGTGIGLTIAKRHVEFLGGRIWLESMPEKGSIFYFTIPK
ncbi:PAS domain S-box protein [Cellulophaga sp. Hel_I_12]|uniref:PAS domain S-box protein n=1 Tax=Cellulophaga sp. Hel_I_12 TaxID=1249972 RepID=UPI000645CA8E|nr:PAS domain S-box protein [Cellulophaga sp. Hel_I_12]